MPSGANHNVMNVSDSAELALDTIYTPPEHEDGITTKEEAEADDEHFDGKTTE